MLRAMKAPSLSLSVSLLSLALAGLAAVACSKDTKDDAADAAVAAADAAPAAVAVVADAAPEAAAVVVLDASVGIAPTVAPRPIAKPAFVDPPICVSARTARRRNSPAAPGLEAQCKAAGGSP